MKTKTGSLYALLVLSAIDDFFKEGNASLNPGALLLDDDGLTIQQAVSNAIKHLNAEGVE